MLIESVRKMNVVTASVGSPAFQPGMQKRYLRGNQRDFRFIIDMVSYLWYYLYMPLLRVEMGNRHGKRAA
jgi:hypothetical protein